MSCSIYSDYGTYLKTRSTYKAICDLKSQIDDYNLTKGGTIDGDLQLIGDLSSNGDIILHNSQIKLINNGRTTYAKGTTLSIIELTPLNLPASPIVGSSNIDISGIVYSNLDNSTSIFNTTTNRIEISDFSNVLQNSSLEIYTNVLLQQGSKAVDYTRIYLDPSNGIGERIYIDTRTVAKGTESNVSYGPVNILTNVNNFLNDTYYIVAEKDGNTDVSFNASFRMTFKQICLS